MNDNDKQRFQEALNSAFIATGRQPLPTPALMMFFKSLEEFSIDQVEEAIMRHLSNPDSGMYQIKPADIVKQIRGGSLTENDVIALAMAKNTPIGVMARKHIGSWNLDNLNNYELQAYATAFIHKLNQERRRWSAGEYTKSELASFVRHDVSPALPFMPGCQKLSENALQALRAAYVELKGTEEFKAIESKKRESLPVNHEGIKLIKQVINDES